MKRFIKHHIVLLLIFLCSFLLTICTQAQPNIDNNDVQLVLDSLNITTVPRNLRKTSDISYLSSNKSLNLTGLASLNISGSQQFSEQNLPLMLDYLDTSLPITIVDLRQESHGFINGYPVSWANLKNDANKDLNKEEVILKESNQLENIELNSTIAFQKPTTKSLNVNKVENEDALVSSKNLSYMRIPVTDGKIPSNHMVDYAVDFFKNINENSWLHFHCKAGEGRTTTFMIMYDMFKNAKNVSSSDIINRQLSLAKFNTNVINSFHNPERDKFMLSFYEYCKTNNDNFGSKWSDFIKTITFNHSIKTFSKNTINSNYIKNSQLPKFLYVISLDKLSPSEKTMIASLQGLVNNGSSTQIYTLNSNEPDYQIWLDDLKSNYNVNYEIISDPWILVDKFKQYVDGYILFSYKNPKDPSINNACSLAALKNSIVINEDIESKVNLHGITNLIGDCRNTDNTWAYDNLWDKGLNHSLLIQLSPDKDSALRDYAILSKALVFYEENVTNTTLRDKIFSNANKNSTCLGWGPDEFINVSTASKYGVSIVASDWSYNLSVLSAFKSTPINQKSSPEFLEEKNVHYVTFVMSDGDNQQWILGNNYSSKDWYGSSLRGSFNMGWSITPSIYYLAPTVLNMYYKSANSSNYNDYFIVSPSGNGYMYPSKFDTKSLIPYIDELNNYMDNVNQKYVSIIDDSSFYDTELWNKFTYKDNIQGLFYLDYHKHDNYQGKILWSNNKPIVSCRDILWKNLEDENDLIEKINYRVNTLEQTNISTPESYTFVYVHAWSKNLEDVEKVINKLKENHKIRVVTPKTFIQLIKYNVTH
ncbi:GxGYxYP domain-containing protein [Clostridium intestinale]|uniref:GxGYxYP domain-containing protein n=1 Tax=Clostridium intestinale TaxID=36845 RepID=UPI0028F08D62|nr:GxGYxYP domain-containing protein [Clostridium intestinale]